MSSRTRLLGSGVVIGFIQLYISINPGGYISTVDYRVLLYLRRMVLSKARKTRDPSNLSFRPPPPASTATMGGCCQRIYYTIVRKKSSYKKEADAAQSKGGEKPRGGNGGGQEGEDWGGWDDDVELAPQSNSRQSIDTGSESTPFIPAARQQLASPTDSGDSGSSSSPVPFYNPRSGGKVRKSKAGWIVRDKKKEKKKKARLATSGRINVANNDPFQSLGMEASGYSGVRKIQVKHKTSAVLKAGSQSKLRSADYLMDDDTGGGSWDLEDDDDDDDDDI